MKMNLIKTLTLAFALTLIHCGGPAVIPPTTIQPGLIEGDNPEIGAKWQQLNLQNYSFSYSKTCYCYGPYFGTITVKNGEVSSIFDEETQEYFDLTGEGAENAQFTIDDIFSWYAWHADANTNELRITEMTLNETYGYPESFHTDIENASDASFYLQIITFTPEE